MKCVSVQVVMRSCLFVSESWLKQEFALPKANCHLLEFTRKSFRYTRRLWTWYFLRWKMLISCASGGTVSRAHGDAKQCKEQWERPKRVESILGVNHSHYRGKKWCNWVERAKKKKKRGEKSKASVRKRWGAGTYSKRCCMSLTPTRRGCSGGSGFCHVDVAEADHGGWWSWVSQCQVSFWLGHHSP